MSHKPNVRKLPRFISVQYRTINVKTISEDAMRQVVEACSSKPNARIAWVKHPAEDDTPIHFHMCASFSSPVRLAEALEALYRADPHNYVKPCRNFRASVRYLAHLDNPEKCRIDPAEIALVGDWDGVSLQTLFERRGATADLSQVLRALSEYLSSRRSCGPFNPIRFALWLDAHGFSSKKAFCMVRMMGLDWFDLVHDVLDGVPYDDDNG